MVTSVHHPTAPPGPPAGGSGLGGAEFEALIGRLSRQSVDRHFDAYSDVAWDEPALAIDPDDTRWELWDLDPLARTDWYRSQAPGVRSRIGLHRVALSMRTGWEFENILQRGLLGFAYRLGNGRPEFRYLHHEVIEESQHTLMFQEFVNRADPGAGGLPRWMKRAAEWFVLPLNHRFPALFFLFVLGGEDPIDHVQRARLRGGAPHPLVERIMKIHVTEEARHLSFARHYLKVEVPRLGPVRRLALSLAAPILLGVMARQMIHPTRSFARNEGIPPSVRRASVGSVGSRELVRDSVAKTRRLCTELGLCRGLPRLLWRVAGVWDPGQPAP